MDGLLSALGDPAGFTRPAEEFCEDQAAEGVRYAEVHFSLPEHGDRLGRWEAPIEAHPLPHLLAAGLRVTLNSDDPAMFCSSLAGEYEMARRVFGLDDDALRTSLGAASSVVFR